MLKRLLLAHILLVTFAVPVVVFAEENEPTPENSSDSLIREGSLCDHDTLGVSEEGSQVKLRAFWIAREYTCPAGQYVAVSTESAECAVCPENSYCPGVVDYEFEENDSDNAYGRRLCDVANGFHTDSVGNTSEQDCFKTETIACSTKNPYTTEHMVSVTYSSANTICTQRQGSEARCDSSCDITGLVCDDGYESRKVGGEWKCVGDLLTCEPGTYLSAESKECEVCPENHFCSGGEYSLTQTEDQGIDSCQNNLKSPKGAYSDKDCGIVFHIGEDALYMHADRRDTDHPAFVIQDSKGRVWYAPMSQVGENRINAKPVSEGATKELHIMYNGEEYTVHTSVLPLPDGE